MQWEICWPTPTLIQPMHDVHHAAMQTTSDVMRLWYRRAGFSELMQYVLREHAPMMYIMSRPPRRLSASPTTEKRQH